MKHFVLTWSIFLLTMNIHAQVGIGTETPNASAQLDITSTTKGFLAPRMTQSERNLISVSVSTKGLLIYQTDNTPGFYYYDGTAWNALSASVGTSFVDLTTDQSVGGLKTFTSIHGLLARGTHGSGTASSLGAGSRMMWYPKKSAFRVGRATDTQWNDGSIGDYSTAMGYGTTASKNYSTAMGQLTTASAIASTAMGSNTTASKNYSTAMGYGTTASGFESTAMGLFTTASGDQSTAMGQGTTASGYKSTAMGDRTTAKSYAETVIGSYNSVYNPNNTYEFDATDRLFVVGNGYQDNTGFDVFSDALVMLKNGNTTFSGMVTGANFATSSDRRLKRNIIPLQQGIDAIMQLAPVSYEKKINLAASDYTIKENGFIAQELLQVMPTLVTEGTDKDKLLSVNYMAIIPVLTKAIQEQQKAIQDQQKQIDELKQLVDRLLKK
jgi:hypothetical protein